MFYSNCLSYTEKNFKKKTLKQNFSNFIEILECPAYYYYFCRASILNPPVNLFASKKPKTITTSNRICFKNRVYLRYFTCNSFTIIILRLFDFFYLALYFYKTYLS
jgi:hypothetical protein